MGRAAHKYRAASFSTLSSRAEQDGEPSEPPCAVEGSWVRLSRKRRRLPCPIPPPSCPLHSPTPRSKKDGDYEGVMAKHRHDPFSSTGHGF